jgi:S-phase kinase-associated protein 1
MPVIKLVSKDGLTFNVELATVKVSGTIASLINDLGLAEESVEGKVIPLPNVAGRELEKFVKWAEQHKNDKNCEDEFESEIRPSSDIPQWDDAFLNMDNSALLHLLLAANYLDVKQLYVYICKKVAKMLKDKTADQIRECFHIINDYTPEEEERVRKENEWCEEKRD